MQVQFVLDLATGPLARDDVAQIRRRKHSLAHCSRLRSLETLYPVWREDQVKVKGSALELYEALSENDL